MYNTLHIYANISNSTSKSQASLLHDVNPAFNSEKNGSHFY